MSTEYGIVVNVAVVTLGSELNGAVSASATTLTLLDAADFSESGGTILIGDDSTELVGYSALDDDTGIMTLATPLVAAYADATKVLKYPLSVEKVADVQIDAEGEAVEALVPVSIYDRLPEGVRDDATAEQVVIAKPAGSDTFTVVDILGAEPLVDAGFLDPTSTGDPLSMSDGLAPAASTAPEVVGLPRILMAKIDGVVNHDPVTYEWHIAVSTAAPTFNGATAHHADGSTLTTFSTLPDGSPLEYDITYYVGVFAYDIDLPTSGASVFSGWSTGVKLDPNGTADIAVEAIKAAQIDVVDLLASGIRTADAGQRVSLSTAEGFAVIDSAENVRVSFPTASDEPLKINSDLITQNADISGLNLRDIDNAGAAGGVFTLESGVSNPTASPTVAIGWPSVAMADASTPVDDRRGLCFYSSKWFMGHRESSGTGKLEAYTTAGVVTTGGFTLPAGMQPDGGLTHMVIAAAQRWLVLCKKVADNTWWVVILDDAGVEQSRWSWPGTGGAITAAAISNDGTNVFIAEHDTGNDYHVSAYTTAGAFVSTTTCTATLGTKIPSEVNGLYVGSADYGAARYVISLHQEAQIRIFNTSGTEQSDTRFWHANAERVAGLAWDGTNFYTASRGSSALYKYSDVFKNTAVLATWESYTWYDSDGTTHETQMSTQIKKTITRRQSITVTTPTIPDAGGVDDPDSVKIYIGYKATTPARTEMFLHASPAPGITTAVISAQSAATNPPAANNFPGATPFKINNSSAATLLSGDDIPAGTWTPVVTASGTNPTTTGASLVGKYRKVNGWVDFEMTLTVNATWAANLGSGTYSVSLPVVADSLYDLFNGVLRSTVSRPIYGEIFVAGKNEIILRLPPATVGGALDNMTGTNPITLINGHILKLWGRYKAA